MQLQKLKNIVWTKRIGHLFERVTDIENIKLAIRRASKRKTQRPSVQRILNDLEGYARKIQEMLLNETFVPAKYTIREIYDGIKKKKESHRRAEILSRSVHPSCVRSGLQRDC